MTDPRSQLDDASTTDLRLLWLAIVLVGLVYFFVVHDLQVSSYERFAPWSDAEGGTGVVEAGQNVAKGLALSLIGMLGVYLILRRDGRPWNVTGWLPALMFFYLAWAAASVLWSINLGMTCKRLAVLMFCVFGAIGFARQFRPRDLAVMAMAIMAAYLAIGIAAEVALGPFRPWSSGYRFAGTVHPNTQGAQLTILCLASFCVAHSATRGRQWLWALFAVGLIFLILTRSRTSCAALAIAFGVLWLVNTSTRTRVLTTVTAGFAVSAAALVAAMFGLDADDKLVEMAMLGRQEESESLSGRFPIWLELTNYARARPLQGYGYEAFWTAKHIEAVSEELQWPLREAHNAYLDCTLSVGLVGAAALLLSVFLAMQRAAAGYRATGDMGFAFTLGMLAFAMVSACLESGVASPNLITLIAGSGVAVLAFVRHESSWRLPSPITPESSLNRRLESPSVKLDMDNPFVRSP